jgi:2-amino-4-hydroxy-6-hydroxymethyldihydropteridine diphosphokinase
MILIALGSNLPSAAGTPAETLRAALAALGAKGIEPVKVSQFYESEAWPVPDDPRFVNAVAQMGTHLSPGALLERLHAVERSFGRVRTARNAPRTLDLDILDYHGRIEAGPPELPHPRMQSRGFVLVPLADIAPEWRHPTSGLSVAELIAKLPDRGREVIPLQSKPR